MIEVTPTMLDEIEPSPTLLRHLAFIALFDFWMANEDRNANNYNLMYDVNAHLFVPIDYGCVFNTATYDYSLSQLTETDSKFRPNCLNSWLQCINERQLTFLPI